MHPSSCLCYLLVAIAAYSIRVAIAARALNFQDKSLIETEVVSILNTETTPLSVDVSTGIHYTPYSKQHPGRHVCTLQKNLTVPVKTKESFCKPVYKKYVEPCHNNQLCTGVRLIYETSYKDVMTSKTTKHITFVCCPGWKQVGNRSHGCTKPICTTECQNEGICVKPGLCKCLKGFTGQYCEADVNECTQHKPCDQKCHNTFGSFKCECRENFVLESDGQTCRREGDDLDPGLEVKELEYEQLDKRLHKLELMFATEIPGRALSIEINKLGTTVDKLSKELNHFKYELENIEQYKSNVAVLNSRLEKLEEATGSNTARFKSERGKPPYLWSHYLKN